MKITEILTESQSLEEGPILNKIGSGIGKAAGTAAKAVGATVGGAVGAWDAAKKGYAAGKAQVAQGGDDEPGTLDTFKQKFDQARANPTAKIKTTQVPGTAPTQAAQPAAAPAAQPQQQAQAASAYKQAQQSITSLNTRQKQAILSMLQKDPKVVAAATKNAAPAATPAQAAPAPVPTQAAPKPAGVKIAGARAKRPAAAPKLQTAGKENLGNLIAEGFTLFKK